MKVNVMPRPIDGEKLYDVYAGFSYIIDSTDKKPALLMVSKFLTSLHNTTTESSMMLSFMVSKFVDDMGAPDVCFASKDGEVIYMLYGDDQHNHGSGIKFLVDEAQDVICITQTDEVFSI